MVTMTNGSMDVRFPGKDLDSLDSICPLKTNTKLEMKWQYTSS